MKVKERLGKVLVVDDNEENLVFLNSLLSLNGYEVQISRSGDEAWLVLQNYVPEVILLDVYMPGMDGYEVCEKIRSSENLKEIPVLFISAYNETTDKVKGFAAGGNDYITKPLQPNELLSRVATHLNLSRSRLQLTEQALKLEKANIMLQDKIEDYRKAQDEIKQLNASLEQRVQQRTNQLLAANKELEAFSYSVSHDLRAPLRAIDGFTRILTEDYEHSLDEEGKRLCRVIRENTQRMGQLIDDLLTFSRLSRTNITTAQVDMLSMARLVFKELIGIKPDKKVIFRTDPIPSVPGDASLLKQVWLNLIDNAIKFSSKKEQPEITISSQTKENMVVYSICDNGAGFDMQYAGNLFGVFQRLHTVKEFDGTGVGLAIVQRIIHKHGGEIWARGVVNEGASFYFSLPLEQSNIEP